MSVAAFYFRMFGGACFSDSDLFVWRISARNKFYDAQGEVPGTEKNQLCPSDCRRPNPLCACCDNCEEVERESSCLRLEPATSATARL